MEHKISNVEKYFDSWIAGDKQAILESLDKEVYIEECYGPCYCGLDEVKIWLDKWFSKGKVLSWEITSDWYDSKRQTYFCKWIFENEYKGKKDKFSGISMITFNKQNQIKTLEEFQTTFEHKFPYHNVE